MKKFEEPIMSITNVEIEDVISTSGGCDAFCEGYNPDCEWES